MVPVAKPIKWVYGVTTVPDRRADLLPRTLVSLDRAGFPSPRIFVDGCSDAGLYSSHPTTMRPPPAVGIYGNWILSMWELFLREPNAHRYAIFQDDLVAYRNLRAYLDRCRYPEHGYWNLLTFPANEMLAQGKIGWFESNQLGYGAVGLVFSRDALEILLNSHHMVRRVLHPGRGKTHVDGGIVESMSVEARQLYGTPWKEYCHYPSLLGHTGIRSTMPGKFSNPRVWGSEGKPVTFRGEEFDAMELLDASKEVGKEAASAISTNAG